MKGNEQMEGKKREGRNEKSALCSSLLAHSLQAASSKLAIINSILRVSL